MKNLRVKKARPTPINLDAPITIPPDNLVNTNTMYDRIGDTLHAMTNTTVEGESKALTRQLQAHNTKRWLPDTEIDMRLSNAVPMSDASLKAYKELIRRRNSVQTRIAILRTPAKTLAEVTGSRLRIGYRLAKYMSHVRGKSSLGMPFIFSMATPNAQVNLAEIPIPYDPSVGWFRSLSAVRNLLAQADSQGYEYSYFIDGNYYKAHGMSILPPPLHDGYYPQKTLPAWEYRQKHYTPLDYRPEMDAPLAIYLNICELLVRHLNIGDDDPEEAAAVTAMLNPKTARLAWPCKDEIETFEEYILIPYIGEKMAELSQNTVIETLKEELHVTHSEALDMVEVYKTYAQHASVFDPLRERSVLLNRLDKLGETCAESGMVTTQLNTYKTILQTLHLTKQPEDSNVDQRASLEAALTEECEANILLGQTQQEQEAI